MFGEDSSKHVVIVDSKGEVIYFTQNNLPVYDLSYNEIIGRNIGKIYGNLNETNSSLLDAVRNGNAVSNLKQGLETSRRKLVYQVGNTYPLIENNSIIGAIEFSSIIRQELFRRADYLPITNRSEYGFNGTRYSLKDIISIDDSMLNLKRKILKVANTNSNIMIYGKTGTGKELVAQSIHNESPRRNAPFISQNCGAMPSNLIESILFGTEAGGFTDAKNRPGIFEMAKGGTVFLDEINSLDLNGQVKLLKALEDKRIRRVGGIKDIDLDIRIIVATNEQPIKLLEKNIMRSDLFYRLSVIQLDLPLLRDRQDDIEYLANYFIDEYNDEFGLKVDYLSQELVDIFKNYNWPGNVRELKNVIESSFNLLDKNKIEIKDLPRNISNYERKPGEFRDLKSYLEEHEKEIILSKYMENNNRLTDTANALNISRQLLRYKLDKYENK